jgi:hypothetical protein
MISTGAAPGVKDWLTTGEAKALRAAGTPQTINPLNL